MSGPAASPWNAMFGLYRHDAALGSCGLFTTYQQLNGGGGGGGAVSQRRRRWAIGTTTSGSTGGGTASPGSPGSPAGVGTGFLYYESGRWLVSTTKCNKDISITNFIGEDPMGLASTPNQIAYGSWKEVKAGGTSTFNNREIRVRGKCFSHLIVAITPVRCQFKYKPLPLYHTNTFVL